ncbi:MAG: spore germination protein [Acutalibacteraceae bacterium]|jgi:stage V sporulation protein AF
MAKKVRLRGDFAADAKALDAALRVGSSFDVIRRDLAPGGRAAALYFVEGLLKGTLAEKVVSFLLGLSPREIAGVSDAGGFAARLTPAAEATPEGDIDRLVTRILAGMAVLVVDRLPEALVLDMREYPVRAVEEPDEDRALRGARDGFVETLLFNTALIRRRLRDPQLTMELIQVGTRSHTDVVMCYVEGKADPAMVERVRQKLRAVDMPNLALGQESLLECLSRRQWYNPFPRARYTERPDCAAASVAEGQILVLMDTTPAVMILPVSLLDFTQDTNDYYFPPLVGSFLRIIRGVVFLMTLLLTPLWYWMVTCSVPVPEWMDFIHIAQPNKVPLLLQIFMLELIIDGLKLASLNTPSSLSNAFSLVGALILGQFAVSAGVLVPEVLLNMAFVAIATFTQPNFELGYAFKMFRLLFLVLITLIGGWGLAVGPAVMLLCIVTTRPVVTKGYLYPLIPFNGKALSRLLLRRAIHKDNS